MIKLTDHVLFGLVVGIFAPLITLYIYARINFPGQSMNEVIDYYRRGNVLSHVISLSVIINLVLFFILLRLKRDNSAKGVVGATILYALFVVGLRFL